MEAIIVDNEITLIPYYPCYEESFQWYQDLDVCKQVDRLIQLCDALAGSEGVLDIAQRMNDVKNRYGYYPQPKWDTNMKLKACFESLAGDDIYKIVKWDEGSELRFSNRENMEG